MSFHEIGAWWWTWTAPMSGQVLVLVLIVALVDRLLARWSWPQLRAALWSLVLIKLVLPPTLTSPVSVLELSMTPAGQAAAQPAGQAAGQAAAFPVPILLFWVWFLGVCLLGSLGTWRYLRLRRQWVAGALVPPPFLTALAGTVSRRLGLRRPPCLVVQGDVAGPAVLGFLRPVVVLPRDLVSGAANGSTEQLEHVLLHELAHVRRRDPLMALACQALQLCYWFHPGVWWATSRLATLRELCCDQTVARVLQDATPRYRRTLLRLSRPLLDRRAGGLAFIHRHSQLLARLEWLERPLPRHPHVRRVVTVFLSGWLLLCCVPLAQPPGPGPAMAATMPLAGLRGCMQLRFAVLQALAEEERRPPSPSQDHRKTIARTDTRPRTTR